MKNQKKINKKNFLFLVLFLTSLISLKTLKKVNIEDIKFSDSEFLSKNEVVNNSSLKFPIRLLFIKTNHLEKELSLIHI